MIGAMTGALERPPGGAGPREEAGPGTVVEIPEDRAHDPREQEPWFLRLPPEARDELRVRWRRAEGTSGERLRRRRDTVLAWVAEAVLLLWFLTYFAWRALPVALVVGAAMGLLGWRAKLGHIAYGWLGAIAFVIVIAVSGTASIASLWGFVLAAFLSALLAQTHRLQRFDGSEV